MLNIYKDIALPVKKCPPGTEPDPGKQWWSRSRPESKWLRNPMMNQCCRLALDSCPKIIRRRLLLLISSSAINLSHLFYLKTLKFRHKQLEPEVSGWKGQFSSRHLVGISLWQKIFMPSNQKPSLGHCCWNSVNMSLREINQFTLPRERLKLPE